MKSLLAGIFIVLIALLGTVALLVGTETGLAISLGQIKKWAPEGLNIESAQGQLVGPLQVNGFTWQTDAFSLAVDSAELEWTPSLLFSRTLKVDLLRVNGVRYRSLGSAEPSPEPAADSEFVLPERLPVPLSVDLNNISVTNVSLLLAPDQEPVTLQSLQLRLNYARSANELTTAMLSVESNLLTAELDLAATTAEQYPFEGMLTWQLRLPELAPMHGAATITGNTEKIRVEPVIAAPYAVNALVEIAEPFDELVLDGSMTASVSDLTAIRADLPPIGVQGQVAMHGSPADIKAEATINLAGVLPQTIQTEINARWQGQLLTLQKALVTVTDHHVAISSKGTIDLGQPSPLFDMLVNWTDVAWPLDAEPLITSRSGTASVQGTVADLALRLRSAVGEQGTISATANLADQDLAADLVWRDLQWPLDGSLVSEANGSLQISGRMDDYLVTLRGNANTVPLANIKLQANGQGSQQNLLLEQLSAEALDGTLQGNGQVTWSPDVEFSLALQGEQLNPAHIAEEFAGALNFKLVADGEQHADNFSATLGGLNIDGILRGLPVTASVRGSGHYTDQKIADQKIADQKADPKVAGQRVADQKDLQISLDELQISSGPTRISASGKVGEAVDVNWSVDSPDLSTLWPDATGAVVGKGLIYGSQQTPGVDMQLSASALGFQDISLKSLQLRANLASAPQGKIAVNLDLNEGQLPGIAISALQLVADGQLDDHQIKLSGRSDQGNIDITMLGSLIEQVWNWDLQTATLAYPELAPWVLQESEGGKVSSTVISAGKTCFTSAAARLCARGSSTNEGLQADYQLVALPLTYFRPLLPEGLYLAGQLESSGELTQASSNDPIANVKLLINEGTVDIDGPEEQSVRVLTLQPTRLTGQLNSAGLALETVLDLGQQGKLDAALTLTEPSGQLSNGALDGYIRGDIEDIGFVQELLPALASLQGRITSDIRLRGTASEPVIAGALTLEQGNAELSAPGITLSAITATLSGKGGSELLLKASAKSAEGSVSIDGTANMATSPVSINAQVTGDSFEVVNTPETHAAISPDLAISFEDNKLQINGAVALPLLHITPKELPSGAVQVSDDQTFADQQSEDDTALPMDVFATVRIIMGKDVLIDAFGLNTGLTGELTVTEVPGKATTASGQLNAVDGTFKAYGQNLQIRRGRIIYVGGPVDRPGFDIEAIREITTELLVGVRARGALSKPQFSLFSEPPLPESEQMSYLIFGRPLEDNSPGEQSAARQAAMALGVAGGTLLTEKFGDKLGLDEVKIDSELRESGEQASLVVGKYLSPKLFVSYGVGLFEPVSTLRLNYFINENVKVVTETTESKSGGDLVFTFESDD